MIVRTRAGARGVRGSTDTFIALARITATARRRRRRPFALQNQLIRQATRMLH